MSRKKTLAELEASDSLRHMTAAERKRRAELETPAFTFGLPPRPQSLDRTTRNLWNKRAGQLLQRRLLARTDGEALMRLVEAELVGNDQLMKDIIAATWRERQPFPEDVAQTSAADAPPEVPVATLADFLAGVRRERATFQQRMRPNETVCLDANGAEYQWPADDPAEVARRYCLEVIGGKILAGELLRRAAQRFLSDLETGATRGLFFDPAAARHVCQFSEQFCGLPLMPWETRILVSIFGFKKPSGARRFTEAWVSCGKKNGKTALASTVGLWMLICDQEKFPDIFSAATKRDQSRLVWRDGKRAVLANPELNSNVQRWAGALSVKETDATWTPLSADEKSMDGLRPHAILADEVAFWSDRDQWDKLSKGVVSRVQPLVFAVTTAGSTKHCFAFGKFDLGEKILRGIYQADETFVAIFSIDKEDDPLNEQCWIKANPSLNTPILKIEHLRKTRDEVLQDRSGLNAWLQYHCNIWPEITLMRQGSIPAAKWAACSGLDLFGETLSPWAATIRFLKLNQDVPCFGGLDVGLTSDMSAFVMLWPRARFAEGQDPIDKKIVVCQFFMPELGLLEKEKAWQVPLSLWSREGWIQLGAGDLTDPRDIRKFILNMASQFQIREVGFDIWGAQVLCADLDASGAVKCTAVPQTNKELTAPAREFLAAIHRQELVTLGNPCLAWHAGNVVLAEDEKHGGTKPEKLSPNEKIDGVSATVNAFHRMLANPVVESVYSRRGLILL
jgi:phage terminase large subunit-like protein